jgi:hypothetical protein
MAPLKEKLSEIGPGTGALLAALKYVNEKNEYCDYYNMFGDRQDDDDPGETVAPMDSCDALAFDLNEPLEDDSGVEDGESLFGDPDYLASEAEEGEDDDIAEIKDTFDIPVKPSKSAAKKRKISGKQSKPKKPVNTSWRRGGSILRRNKMRCKEQAAIERQARQIAKAKARASAAKTCPPVAAAKEDGSLKVTKTTTLSTNNSAKKEMQAITKTSPKKKPTSNKLCIIGTLGHLAKSTGNDYSSSSDSDSD